MSESPNLKDDLPLSMTMAAFVGISWYIGAEINISMFSRFNRWTGLYFWACALCSWGVILQPLFIILADFDVWTNLTGSITMIYLTWLIMVVPQSWVLYSRLHLITLQLSLLRWTLAVLILNSIVFSIPTIVIGILAQATEIDQPSLSNVNAIWDPLQATVFFAQETFLNILYIWQTHKLLRNASLLGHLFYSESPSLRAIAERKRMLHQLIYTNLLVIALDIALLGIRYANMFYLQGAFKPCVYGVKLKVEFVILNRLIKSVRARGEQLVQPSTAPAQSSSRSQKASWWSRLRRTPTSQQTGDGVRAQNVQLEAFSGGNVRRLNSQGSEVPIIETGAHR